MPLGFSTTGALNRIKPRAGRSKPHILFVAEKWCDYSPNCGPSPSEHCFWGPLEACGVATYSVLHPDEYYLTHQQPIDAALLRRCIDEKPDLIFLIYLIHDTYNPQLETLLTIRADLGIPIVTWWGDTNVEDIMRLSEILSPFVDMTFAGNSTAYYSKHAKRIEKYHPLPHAKDPRIFHDPGYERSIDVSFVGSSNRPERSAALAALKADGIDVYQTGGQREKKLSIQEYADVFMRSKITINLVVYGGVKTEMINGRVFEATSCGTLLLEPEWSNTKNWFEPMKDYVPYTDHADLVRKIRYYLEHNEERIQIATQGKLSMQKRFAPAGFWDEVFECLTRPHILNCEDGFTTAALSRFGRGNLFGAFQMVQRALTSNPESFDALYLAAEIMRADRQFSEAIRLYDQALATCPQMPKCLLGKALCYEQCGESQSMHRLINETLGALNQTKDSDTLYNIAQILARANKLPEAADKYLQLISQNPAHLRGCVGLAEMLFRIDKWTEGEQLITGLIKAMPMDKSLHSALAEMFDRLDLANRAAEHRWLSARPTEQSAAQVRQEAWFQQLLGESHKAIEMIERFLNYQDNSELFDRLNLIKHEMAIAQTV